MKFHIAITAGDFIILLIVCILDEISRHTHCANTYVTTKDKELYVFMTLTTFRERLKSLRHDYAVTGVKRQQRNNNTPRVFIKCAVYLNFKLLDVYILFVLRINAIFY